MTPHYSFTQPDIKQALIDLGGVQFVDDIVAMLMPMHLAKNQVILYGDLEKEPADIVVLNTGHELTSSYLSEIGKLL